MRLTDPRCFCAILFVLLASNVALADVLVCAAADAARRTDVQTKLQGTGLITGNVDEFDAVNGTPTLVQLQAYESVLVFCNNTPDDRDLLGDNLADYVDAGGSVVIATFGLNTGATGVGGRFNSGGYSPLAFGSQTSGTQLTLGTIQIPGHPLVAGVATFDGGTSSFHNVTSLTTGATLVADWSNGDPLVAHHDVGPGSVVALNMYPPSSDVSGTFWDATTDGDVLMANALNWGSTNVMIAYASPAGGTDVQSKIRGTGLIDGVISLFDAGVGTPALNLLQVFDAVLVHDDSEFDDHTAIGDNLADYVDGGGRVVECMFCYSGFYAPAHAIDGRWFTGGYDPIQEAATITGNATLGTVALPAHPLMNNVTTFDGGTSSFRTPAAIQSTATLVASWSTGEVLVCFHAINAGTVVGLNFYPISSDASANSWDSTTDGDILMANALLFDSGGASGPEIDVQRPAGTSIASGSSDVLGNLNVGVPTQFTYTIANTGTADLNVTGIAESALSNCAVAIGSLTPASPIAAAGSATFTVDITPTTAAAFSFTLTITNDDANEGTYTIDVGGTGVAAPEIDLQIPAGTSIANGGTATLTGIATGSANTVTVTIENQGLADLTLSANPTATAGTNCTASVTTNPPSLVVGASTTTTFVVTITPALDGAFDLTVTVTSDDADEGTYTITLNGTAATSTGGGGGGGSSCCGLSNDPQAENSYTLGLIAALFVLMVAFAVRRRV